MLRSARVLPVLSFTVKEAVTQWERVVCELERQGMHTQTLIVRSSAQNEDTAQSSNAGKFLSIGNVRGEQELLAAVKEVAAAMGENEENQVFIQPYLEHVELCGVAFTADPNTGGNYYVINYDDKTGSTSSVTDGTGSQLEVFYHFKEAPFPPKAPLDQVVALCKELESIFESPCLDLEFAFSEGVLYLFQVRPLILRKPLVSVREQRAALERIATRVNGVSTESIMDEMSSEIQAYQLQMDNPQ